MDYNKIIAVTGLPGLFELVSSKTDGALVRSLDDKITKFVSSRVHNFSHLETIEVYTTTDNVNLVDVFKAMKDSGATLPDNKDAAAVKKYFETAFPSMDFERVYASDMKKMLKWYEVLSKNDVEFKITEEPEEETAELAQQSAPSVVEIVEKPEAEKKKPAKKKVAETTDVVAETAEAPKKKAPAKKKKAEE
ncbi:MAG: DUF5606 domain-containing protein [Chitinophagaceae bacterium]|nr:DUF5606 domain-containing protein [Chitinophagaceae bacterium]